MSNSSNESAQHNQDLSSLHERAEDNLRFIRSTMEQATAFTGVSGKGYVIAGLSAAIASYFSFGQDDIQIWLAIWLFELCFAAGCMLVLTAIKARAQGSSLWSSNGKKLLLAFCPAMLVGGVLTVVILQFSYLLLPGVWLSLYGASVITAGAYSIRVIPLMGLLFILLGTGAFFSVNPELFLGWGFGGLHLLFGVIIWKYYGG